MEVKLMAAFSLRAATAADVPALHRLMRDFAIAPAEPVLSEKQRAEVDDVSAMLTSNLEKITEHGKRAGDIVKAMLEHSRGSSGERRMVDLNALIDEALNLAYHGARAGSEFQHHTGA
jgi:two-component system NtrC family sensor kinase